MRALSRNEIEAALLETEMFETREAQNAAADRQEQVEAGQISHLGELHDGASTYRCATRCVARCRSEVWSSVNRRRALRRSWRHARVKRRARILPCLKKFAAARETSAAIVQGRIFTRYGLRPCTKSLVPSWWTAHSLNDALVSTTR